jgi:hypothetical protein
MRKIANVFSVSVLALAVLLGIADGRSAAEDKATAALELCFARVDACGWGCVVDFGNCIEAFPSEFCHAIADACQDVCDSKYKACLSGASKGALKKFVWLTSVLGAQHTGGILTLEALNRLSVKLDNLAAQVGAASPIDLVALPAPGSSGPEGFCQLNNTLTNLQVHVSNQGTVGSPASTTHVDFANNPGVDIPTPALGPHGTAVVEFAIPANCYDVSNNCHFTITVDSTNAVIEANGETNNSVAGVCGASVF